MKVDVDTLCGVVLAGGRGRRMGGEDKGLVAYQGRPLIEHVLQRLQPQLKRLTININRNQAHYQQYKLPLFDDLWADFRGPLAGIATAFSQCNADYLLFCPCDTPQLPEDLVARLIETINRQSQSRLAVVASPRGLQPLFCLMHRSLEPSLLAYLARGERRVQQWIKQQQPAICHYDSDAPFQNINSLQALKRVHASG